MRVSAPPLCVAVLVVLAGLGCHGKDDSRIEIRSWFKDEPRVALRWCADPPEVQLDSEIRVALYFERGVSARTMRALVEPLRAYLGHYGIRLVPYARTAEALKKPLFPSSRDEVDEILRGVGLDPENSEDRRSREAARALARPVLRFLDERAREPTDRVQLVFAREVLGGANPLRGYFHEPVALTVSRFLELDRGGAELSALLERNTFVPTSLLSTSALRQVGSNVATWVLLHEFGHALGLDHSRSEGTPMDIPDDRTCIPPFRAEQLEKMNAGIQALVAE